MDNWINANIGDVIEEIQTGTTPPTSNSLYFKNPSINWFSPSDFDDNRKTLEFSKNKVSEIAVIEGKAKIYPKNTLLLVAIGATIGKVGILHSNGSSNQQITGLTFNSNIFIDYAYYWFRYIKEIIIDVSSSATLPIINQKGIKELPFKYPKSYQTQINIATKLDILFGKINNSIELLEENLIHSKSLMGSILDEVFTNLEHTSKVVKISKIADIKGGKRLPKGEQLQDSKTEYPYIRVTDFNDNGSIDVDNLKYMAKEIQSKISRYIITSDDLYISIAGTIGKTGIIPKELDGANLTENAARFVYKDKKSISNKFVYYYTKSDKFKAFVAEATKQVAQPKLALTRLNEIELALPSIIEQEKAVEKFIEMENTLLKMEKEIQIKLNNMKALKSSLLDQAFKGEL